MKFINKNTEQIIDSVDDYGSYDDYDPFDYRRRNLNYKESKFKSYKAKKFDGDYKRYLLSKKE